MIYKLIQPIDAVINALPFVGRYGGIVNTASRLVEISTDANGDTIFREERFPIACGVTNAQCWEEGRYQDLIPNDAYTSVFYLEQTDGMRYDGIVDKIAQQNFHGFTERLRLVGWLNLAKLGVSECAGHSAIAFHVIKALNRKWKALTDPMNIFSLEVRVVNQEPKSANPFTKYTYQDLSAMWLYPYDYCSFILEVKVVLNQNCIEEFEAGADISCYIDDQMPEPPDVGTNFGYQLYDQRWPYFRYTGEKVRWITVELGAGTDGQVEIPGLLRSDVAHIVKTEFRAKNSDADPLWDTIPRFLQPHAGGGWSVYTNAWQEFNEVTIFYVPAS